MKTERLRILGFDDWHEGHAAEELAPGQCIAKVMTVDRGSYIVRMQDGECRAELTGRFYFDAESSIDIPSVGDWICVEKASPDLAIIQAVLPRKTFLRRKTPGKSVDFQMIAANIDIAFIVQSCHYDYNISRLERYLVSANEGGLEPVIVLTKTDMVSSEELSEQIAAIRDSGIEANIFSLSNATGEGLSEFAAALVAGKTYCLLGSSGVGKTTLLNRLLGNEMFETKCVSNTGEGVHTTSRRQLTVLDNGAILIDTPGMREFGLLSSKESVNDSFSDINELSCSCRFADCSHTAEPGCAVLSALDEGELKEERYRNYIKLRKEVEFNDMSYLEKRKKDQAFGRFIKSAKKEFRPKH